MRQRGDARREALDLARNESSVDQGAQPGVYRRLERQQRGSSTPAGREMLRRLMPVELRAPSECRIVGRNAGRAAAPRLRNGAKAPEAVLLPEEHRRRGADLAIGGIGIVEKGGIARVESETRRAAASIWSIHMSCHEKLKRIGSFDDVGAAAAIARGIEHEVLASGTARQRKLPARAEIFGDRWGEPRRSRASVTCGMKLRGSGGQADAAAAAARARPAVQSGPGSA